MNNKKVKILLLLSCCCFLITVVLSGCTKQKSQYEIVTKFEYNDEQESKKIIVEEREETEESEDTEESLAVESIGYDEEGESIMEIELDDGGVVIMDDGGNGIPEMPEVPDVPLEDLESVTASEEVVVEAEVQETPPATEAPPATEEVAPEEPPATEEVAPEAPPATEEVAPEAPPATEEVVPEAPPATEEVAPEAPPVTEEVAPEAPPATEEVAPEAPPATEEVAPEAPPVEEPSTEVPTTETTEEIPSTEAPSETPSEDVPGDGSGDGNESTETPETNNNPETTETPESTEAPSGDGQGDNGDAGTNDQESGNAEDTTEGTGDSNTGETGEGVTGGGEEGGEESGDNEVGNNDQGAGGSGAGDGSDSGNGDVGGDEATEPSVGGDPNKVVKIWYEGTLGNYIWGEEVDRRNLKVYAEFEDGRVEEIQGYSVNMNYPERQVASLEQSLPRTYTPGVYQANVSYQNLQVEVPYNLIAHYVMVSFMYYGSCQDPAGHGAKKYYYDQYDLELCFCNTSYDCFVWFKDEAGRDNCLATAQETVWVPLYYDYTFTMDDLVNESYYIVPNYDLSGAKLYGDSVTIYKDSAISEGYYSYTYAYSEMKVIMYNHEKYRELCETGH